MPVQNTAKKEKWNWIDDVSKNIQFHQDLENIIWIGTVNTSPDLLAKINYKELD